MTLLLIIPAALVLIPITAAVGALGAIGIGVASLAIGDAKREIPADDGSAPDPSRGEDGVDPAWPHYLACQAVNDAVAAADRVLNVVDRMWESIRSLQDGFHDATPPTRVLLGPLMMLPYIAGVAASLGVGAGALVVSSVTVGAAGVLWVVRRASITVVRLVDRALLRRAGAGGTCTAHGCFGFTQLPTVECDCGRLHIQLQPGHYGVLRRRCSCGEVMPSTVARAASTLLLRCRWCQRPLLAGAMLDMDVRVAVIGASSAGKTSFANAALDAMCKAVVDAGGSVDLFSSGQPEEDNARCTSARITIGRRHGTLHLFDAPGRVLDDQLQRTQLYYLQDTQGFALVIDPMTIPWLAAHLQDSSQRDSVIAYPEVTYRAVTAQLLDSRIQLKRRSLAVVLNKADLLEASLDSHGPEPRSNHIRNWLSAHGQDNLVKAADRDFGSVRYFLANSAGEGSASASAALRWLAGRSGLSLPAATSSDSP
ncbi:MAG: TRAFAC clade GTPase domain-containing protein [Pseudonocardiaceae bacterium]